MLSTDYCDHMSSTLSLCAGDPGFKSCLGKPSSSWFSKVSSATYWIPQIRFPFTAV